MHVLYNVLFQHHFTASIWHQLLLQNYPIFMVKVQNSDALVTT